MTHLRVIEPSSRPTDGIRIDGCAIVTTGKCGCRDTLLATVNASIGDIFVNVELHLDGCVKFPRGVSLAPDKRRQVEDHARQAALTALIEAWSRQREGHR